MFLLCEISRYFARVRAGFFARSARAQRKNECAHARAARARNISCALRARARFFARVTPLLFVFCKDFSMSMSYGYETYFFEKTYAWGIF